jgi:hypothetical protein
LRLICKNFLLYFLGKSSDVALTIKYGSYINILLTALFVVPLWKYPRRISGALRRATIRTLIAAIITSTMSFANVLVLTLMGGVQSGWLCLDSCTLDITVNALALFWVAKDPPVPRKRHETEEFVLTTKVVAEPTLSMQADQQSTLPPCDMSDHPEPHDVCISHE